jgi:hypothetical protein
MMSLARHMIETFRARPGYAAMRAFARLDTLRKAVPFTRSIVQHAQWQATIKDCVARRAATVFPGIDPVRFVSELQENGIAFGLRLPAEFVTQIFDYAQKNPCYADREPDKGFPLSRRAEAEKILGKPILVAQYFNTASCPAIVQLCADPVLQEIAARYLQSVPTLVGTNLWWTFPVQASEEERANHAHLFHRDVDDFRFFKFFFYITEVPKGDGAHVCVVASHRRPPEIRPRDKWSIRRYSDAEIESYYPKEKILEITGKPGEGFSENTLCIHKGLTPASAPRLLLQLQYALFDYGVLQDRRDPSSLKMIA